MKKALQLASVASMIDQFNISNIELMQSLDYQVDVVADFTNPGNISHDRAAELIKRLETINVRVIAIAIPRSLNPKAIISAYRKVKKLIATEHYDLIHCHSPIGGAIARFAAQNERKNGTRVIYTAHGFHFYDGAPLKNWLIFYPIEKFLSLYTDVLITINKEDYKRATEHFCARKIEYVPGVGIDTQKFRRNKNGRKRIRDELGVTDQQRVILSVGELNKNKNHETIIKAISGMDLVYVIVGQGGLKERLLAVSKECGVDLRLVGFRSDVADFYSAADIYVLPSLREGLNVSLMEAMANGLPCIASNIRGNVDLIDNQCLLVDSNDVKGFANVLNLLKGNVLIEEGQRNIEKIQEYDKKVVLNEMQEIYEAENEKGSRLIGEKLYE